MLSMILPRICVGCGLPSQDADRDLCAYCIPNLPWLKGRCYQCGEALGDMSIKCTQCREDPPPYDRLCALFSYKQPLIKIIQRLKFGRRIDYSRLLGELLTEKINSDWYN